MILACHNLSKSFGDQVIVKDGSFHIENHEKAALVGLNGAGKSTILKMIVGQLSPDAGTVVLTKGKTLGYLAQHQEMESGNTIYEEVRTAKAEVIEMEKQIRTIEIELPSLSGDALEARLATYQRLTSAFEHADGYAYKSELTGVLKGLGFTEEEFTKPVDSLSGGQKTRVSLGKLLLTKPDVLLLDEPTNHLDMNSIAWLETYLLNYPGAVLIVSHDRYFLNRVVTKVIEVEQGQLHTYMGNYSDFAVKKEQLREARLKEYLNQQREIKHQEAVIEKLRSFNREKSIKRAESREKMLDKMTLVDKPMEINTDIHLKLEPSRVSGNDVLSVKGSKQSLSATDTFHRYQFRDQAWGTCSHHWRQRNRKDYASQDSEQCDSRQTAVPLHWVPMWRLVTTIRNTTSFIWIRRSLKKFPMIIRHLPTHRSGTCWRLFCLPEMMFSS